MSLRLRLTLLLGSVFLVIWIVAATWMLLDLRQKMSASLDQRLAASARMVAGLLAQLPVPVQARGAGLAAMSNGLADGLVCQISSLRGEVLVRSSSSADLALDAKLAGFHDQLIDGQSWRSFSLSEGELRVTTADRMSERQVLEHSIVMAASVPVAVALLGSLVLFWLGIGKGLAPLERMRTALKRRSADSLEPLHVHGLPGELQPLLDAQNQLLQRVGDALERERRLTGDAAHELRSPLTVIKSHLQVAQMTNGHARDIALANAERGADRLQRTLEQLLMLARVEGSLSFDDGQQGTAFEVASLAIGDAGQGSQRIKFGSMVDIPTHRINMPIQLAVVALRNLLDNALQHGPADTPVELQLSLEGAFALFHVLDHGSGVSEENLNYLTQRFWRDSRGVGSGLGLAIVQAIANRCGGELKLESRPDGFRAWLSVPCVLLVNDQFRSPQPSLYT